MEPLATAEHLAARLGRSLTEAESARADALLADASALVRSYTGQDFGIHVDDTAILRGQGDIRLPQRPVTEVKTVVAIGGDGLPDITLADWWWDGLDQIRIGPGNWVINLPEVWWDDDGWPGTYRVTYSHGYAETPPDVVAVICSMVLRTMTAPSMRGGVKSESIGSYSYQLETAGVGLTVSLTQPERDVLARYRRKAATNRISR